MAIVWRKSVYDSETGTCSWVVSKTTHVGLVVGFLPSREIRVMSDVYAMAHFVTVYDPATKTSHELRIGTNFENDTRSGVATVDILPEHKAVMAKAAAAAKVKADAYRSAKEAEEVAAKAARLEAEARAAVLPVVIGAEVVVIKGRKVKVGTRGVVFWAKDGEYGPRVGLKDSMGKEHWTSEDNVKTVVPGMGPYDTPVEGWAEYSAKSAVHSDAWHKAAPKKGSDVIHLASGVRGYVFWKDGVRIGVKRKGAKKGEDAIWCDAWEVSLVARDGTATAVPRYPAPLPFTAAPVAPKAGFTDLDVNSDPGPVTKPAPLPLVPALAHLPEPYCRIRGVKAMENGCYNALGKDGQFLMTLTAKSAAQIRALLETS